MGFRKWVEERGLSENTSKTAVGAVRSFFAFNRVTLELRRSEARQLTEAKRKTEDYRFSREDLKRMADVGDLEEKYVVVVGKSFGLRASDFLRLTRGDLEPYVNREIPICIGPISTQKESVTSYPFIDIDALPIIKLMLERMTRESRTKPDERMLTFENEISLSRVLKKLADEAGIEHGNKIIRFHCLRKFLIDRLASHMSTEKWKQIVGKKISEGAYVSPDSLREDYSRAMTDTRFSTTQEGDIATLAKIEALKALAKTMGITDEQLSSLARKPFNATEYLKELEATIEKKKWRSMHDGGCDDGVHCPIFEQIPESELLGYLQKGWQIVHKMASGEVIVKSE